MTGVQTCALPIYKIIHNLVDILEECNAPNPELRAYLIMSCIDGFVLFKLVLSHKKLLPPDKIMYHHDLDNFIDEIGRASCRERV